MSEIVVTGVSAGVGRAVVRAFARYGYNLGLIARGMESRGRKAGGPSFRRDSVTTQRELVLVSVQRRGN